MPNPVRFSPAGPDGWVAAPDVPIEHAEILDGSPVGRDHAYFAQPGLRAGIWCCGVHTESCDNYPVDEFIVVLDGEVTLMGDEGFSNTYRKGEPFLLPKGFRGTWHQPGPMLKYCVIIG